MKRYKILAGDLHRRITVQKGTKIFGEKGNPKYIYDPGNIFTVWADYNPYVADKIVQNDQIISETNYKIIVRYGVDINEHDLLIYNGQKLKPSGPPYDLGGEHKYLQINCKELD